MTEEAIIALAIRNTTGVGNTTPNAHRVVSYLNNFFKTYPSLELFEEVNDIIVSLGYPKTPRIDNSQGDYRKGAKLR